MTFAAIVLPEPYETGAYRSAHPDLVDLSSDELRDHYRTHGEGEGRRANGIRTREDFAALVPIDARSLEIGPYFSPLLRGPNTKYFDILSREAMMERAGAEGVDGERVPEIDFVSPIGDLGVVDATFDFAFSSHTIEHQPDLVTHLQSVERLLEPGGRYFAIVPDKRYCYDHFSPESSLAEVVEAFYEKRTTHTLKSVLGQTLMTAHNDCVRHWNGDHGPFLESAAIRIKDGIDEFVAAGQSYVDVHAWYFTPESVATILGALREAAYTSFEVERLYPTRRDSFEFWMVLRKL
jgi:SAM-dependent methyltransferase